MNWKEHHSKNANRCLWMGSFVLIGGLLIGFLCWKFEWIGSTEENVLTTVEISIIGILLIGVGFSQKRKAGIKKTAERFKGESNGESWVVQDAELMIKSLSSFQSTYRYFSINGEILLEFKETSKLPFLIVGFVVNGLNHFLKRSFILSDRHGRTRLIFKQNAGLNTPIEIFLPTGEKIAHYKEAWMRAEIDVYDGKGTMIGKVKKDDVLGTTFTVFDQDEHTIMRFYNGGLPSKNYDYWSSSDDLIKIMGNLSTHELLFRQTIALPAFLKMKYKK
ncbi:hypothetical protein JOC86_000022 [Bacillus pakistanensis]|uniref:Uncharacterized protein n=1 Tax=Rossellomorea pakistanensis TaxID=992288 RepID=A0ABS2N6Q2_9BACI|nr:hypothetical protein [Bacillus pakistanensis]MBM7583485.1 hypothetical protein [Bacillus pakistanensis]